MPAFSYLEFFAGAGMVRLGLGSGWNCILANDIDTAKANAYRANFDCANTLVVGDVGLLTTEQIAGHADLAWASFPCQDLSLAGNGAGLGGERSGVFWSFWKIIKDLRSEGREPELVALENVHGALTSNNGRDFTAIIQAMADEGYRVGALVIDAVHFLPQSRPRLFIVGVRSHLEIPKRLISAAPNEIWHSQSVVEAYERLTPELRENWVWWRVPAPKAPRRRLADLIEEHPVGVEWHSKEQTAKLLGMMSPVNAAKVNDAIRSGRRQVGTVYKRTRSSASGEKVQRAEVRFDGIAGCLRTPGGGSSRQTVLVVEGNRVRSRLLSTREAARLMGLPESYRLPDNYNEAYHLAGDGVAVPVVRHLARALFKPLLSGAVASIA